MILVAAVLGFATVFLSVFVLGKAIGPQGELGKKKEISKRIFKESNTNLKGGVASTLVRSQRLSEIHRFQEYLEKQAFVPKLTLLLKRSGSKFSVGTFLLFHLSIACILVMVVSFFAPPITAIMLGAGALYYPFMMLRKKNKQYMAKFSEHLSDASSIIANNLKVGQSIEMAMEAVAKNAPHPVSAEFQTVNGEVKLGLPLAEALRNLYKRVPTEELKIFITGINIQQELGGNLSEIMGNLEKTVRERYALQREIKVLSAQGVLSMWVLLALPFVFAMVWFTTDRPLFIEFITSSFGNTLMAISAGVQAVAFFVMKKIVVVSD